jgi:hypothetical protein
MSHWRDHAICQGQTEIFFSHKPKDQKKADKLCATCPVTGACAQEAFTLSKKGELFGFWGGTTKQYRESIVGKSRGAWWELPSIKRNDD